MGMKHLVLSQLPVAITTHLERKRVRVGGSGPRPRCFGRGGWGMGSRMAASRRGEQKPGGP